MVDLFCTPFAELIQRMRLEFRNQQTIFDLPARKWYLPPAPICRCDFTSGLPATLAARPLGRKRRWHRISFFHGSLAVGSWNSRRFR
jgi:hypothetical protein